MSGVQSQGRRDAYAAATAAVRAAAAAYDTAASRGELHTVPQHTRVGPTLTTDDMTRAYERGMVGGAGRTVYSAILAGTKRCPLCGHRDATTLDHHLPKALYPSLAVTPANLVPACRECNSGKKKQNAPTTAEEQTLHPYYDDLGSAVWLRGRVVAGTPAAVQFEVSPPASWDATTAARVRNHFDQFGLAELYSVEAAEEMQNVRLALTHLHDAGGDEAVRLHLVEQAASRAAHQHNSWQTATYHALAESSWYCGGGFRVDR